MGRCPRNPLRPLQGDEIAELERVSRSHIESSIRACRAKAILAVNRGATYGAAAFLSGRKSDRAVSQLVKRFNLFNQDPEFLPFPKVAGSER